MQEKGLFLKYLDRIGWLENSKSKWMRFVSGNLSLLNGRLNKNFQAIGNAFAALGQLESLETEQRLQEIRAVRSIHPYLLQENSGISRLLGKMEYYNGMLVRLIGVLKQAGFSAEQQGTTRGG